MKNFNFLFVVCWFFWDCSETKNKADLIIHGGRIYTCDSSFSVYSAMAIKNGRVLATGSDRDILSRYASDSIISLNGNCVYPGFHDAHAHFFGLAQTFRIINLKNTASWESILDTLIKYSKNSTGWIIGRGWDQNDWKAKIFPDKEELDRLFPDRPVFLKRIDGHAAIANSAALKLAGINEKTIIPGGEIKISQGKLTGVLIDNAMRPVEKVIPKPDSVEMEKLLLKAQEVCLLHGITAVTECGIDYEDAMLIHRMQKENKLKLCFAVMLSDQPENLKKLHEPLPESDRFRIIGVKAYADGALGSRGACLLQPYSDTKRHYGLMLCSIAHLDSVAKEMLRIKKQLCTHAIGDSAVRVVLDVYARYLTSNNKLNWRIEHCQVVHPSDLPKFKKHKIIPSVQPTHALSDGPWAIDRLGEGRIRTAYAYRTLSEFSDILPLGTDFPVEDVNPMGTFAAAVFRKNLHGEPKGGYYPEEKLSREKTLWGMTKYPAQAAGFKHYGYLTPGTNADFIVTDVDLNKIPEHQITRLKNIRFDVYIDGKKINYRN
ncbi:MAG: amidohydrolase [Bacteroidia bacterium]|nr:amidohydrolase [Bacteroidia bacterium]